VCFAPACSFSRKKAARLVHTRAAFATKVRGLRAKLFNKTRYAEKATLKKTINMHEERDNKHKNADTVQVRRQTNTTEARAVSVDWLVNNDAAQSSGFPPLPTLLLRFLASSLGLQRICSVHLFCRDAEEHSARFPPSPFALCVCIESKPALISACLPLCALIAEGRCAHLSARP
jgi:hypothetical protein